MSRGDETGFLGRWSALKLKARAEPEPEPAQLEPVVPPADTVPEKTDAEILQELGLPDPDELRKGDDFAAFMRAAVPERLRARALRRLWLTDPVLANVDGLVDYGQDFTDAATVVENLQTAYRVGKGFLREDLAETPAAAGEAAAERAEAPAPTEPAPVEPAEAEPAAPAPGTAPSAGETAPADGGTGAEHVAADAEGPGAAAEVPGAGAEAPPSGPRQRRMRFRFDSG